LVQVGLTAQNQVFFGFFHESGGDRV
jgi:hypothetical protein